MVSQDAQRPRLERARGRSGRGLGFGLGLEGGPAGSKATFWDARADADTEPQLTCAPRWRWDMPRVHVEPHVSLCLCFQGLVWVDAWLRASCVSLLDDPEVQEEDDPQPDAAAGVQGLR